MSWTRFVQRLEHHHREKQSDLALMLAPRLEKLPLPIQRYDDPFFPFTKAIVKATSERVVAYLFDMAAYLSLGAAGARALERSLAFTRHEALTILHGPFVGPGYVAMASATAFAPDAVTLASTADLDVYLQNEPHAAFVVGEQVETPEQGGLYQDERLRLRGTESEIVLRVLGDAVVYAGRSDDFAERCRQAVEAAR